MNMKYIIYLISTPRNFRWLRIDYSIFGYRVDSVLLELGHIDNFGY
jgi:hypothetical protein